MIAARILRLNLANFRSYHAAAVAVGDGPIVLVGPNGAGKTNVLEAISFLGPGRGLRHATLDDVAFSEGDGSWAVSAEVEGALGLRRSAPALPHPDAHWLDAIEHETAELAVAVASARAEAVNRLSAALAARNEQAFPAAAIALEGWIDDLVPNHPAMEVEDRYRAVLKENRAR